MSKGIPVTAAAARAAMAARANPQQHVTLEAELQTVHNSASQPAIRNGLSDAVGFPSTGIPGYPTTGNERISDSGTIFKNLRGYLISNMRQVLSQAYVEIGLIQTVVDVPVDDAMRGGFEIKSKQLDETQIEELKQALDDEGDLAALTQAAKWNRLFGGAGMIVMTDQDPEEPLDIEAIGPDDRLEFRAADMWELFSDDYNDVDQETSLEPVDEDGCYTYYGVKVHKSRVFIMKGLVAPSFVRVRLRGWGFSVVEILVRSINQYLKATDLSFEVLDEFKLDVYKIKNLVSTLMMPNGEQAIKKRVTLANWQKNYQNAVVMDSEDDFDHKQLSFAGLAEAQGGIRMQVASDLRMPLTKIFGISAAGFSSGEEDLEVYNAMVESQVRVKIKKDAKRIAEIRCQKLFGMVPDDLSLNFRPLRVLSATDEETVKTQKFARLIQAKERGEITDKEFRDACNKGDLFDIKLDTSEDVLSEIDAQQAELAGAAAGAGTAETGKSGAGGDEARKAAPAAKTAPDGKALNAVGYEVGVTTGTTVERRRIRAYTALDRFRRGIANSPDFDRAAYEADGGDGWLDPRRAEFFTDPTNVDPGLWRRAEQASVDTYGAVKWQFVVWWYEKQGGIFKERT